MPYQHQHCRARENRKVGVRRATVLPHAPQILKPASTQQRAIPTALDDFSIFKVFKYSLQHHKQFFRCFGLSASSRKGNSGLLQPMAVPYYFSPCLGCPPNKLGTRTPLDTLEKPVSTHVL